MQEILFGKQGIVFGPGYTDVNARLLATHVRLLDNGTFLTGAVSDTPPSAPSSRVFTLYDEALDGFARFPEALVVRDGRILLPGGEEADAVWADTVGARPSAIGDLRK